MPLKVAPMCSKAHGFDHPVLNPVDVIAVAILEVVFCVVIAPCAPPADES